MDDSFINGLRRYFAENPQVKPATVAAQAGLDKSTIRKMLDGTVGAPKLDTAEKIATVLGLTVANLSGEPAAPIPARIEPGDIVPNGAALIPVYAVSASAGSGAMVADYEEVTHSLAFPPDYLNKLTSSAAKNLAIINVVGESMQPTLRHDDIVMIDQSRKNLAYDGLFALLFDDMLHVKRVSRSEQRGFVKIISDNPLHPPLEYPINDVTVVGRVLWRGGKM